MTQVIKSTRNHDTLSVVIEKTQSFPSIHVTLTNSTQKWAISMNALKHGAEEYRDGMFGPGTGSFFALSGVALQGRQLLEATAIAKTLNFATNLASLLVFMLAGQVLWGVGLVMMAGQAAGAWVGSHLLFRIDPQYLRVLIVLICLAMLTRYLSS